MNRFVLAAWIVLVSGFAPSIALPQVVGQPTVGAPGITVRVDELMQRQHQRDIQGPRPHPVKPRLRPDRSTLPQDPAAAALSPASQAYPSAWAPGQPALQATSTGFTGATLADTGAFPPDTMGAVGPSQFVVTVNGRFRTFNKTTGAADEALNVDPDVFFASVMTPVTGSVIGNFTSDPHVRYDRLSGRWIIVMIDVPYIDANITTVANRVLIAVSSGATIADSSSFTLFQFNHDTLAPAANTGNFADYPTPGIDNNAIYIGANIFTSAGAFASTSGFVVRKSSVLGAGPIVATAFRGLVPGAASDGPYTPQGVDNYDAAATEGYFIGVSNAAFGKLMLRRVRTPGGTPTISADIPLIVPATQYPLTVPHLGNTGGTNGNLDNLDDRLFAAHLRNGRLWTAHSIGVNNTGTVSGKRTRNGSRWYEIRNLGTTPSLVQSGTVFTASAGNATDQKNFWIPAITVSGQGHAAMGFSTAGTNHRANAGYTGRLAGDAAGTMATPADFTASSTAYNPAGDPGGAGGRRWGDYSFTSVDPEDDMTMWTIQEFCDAANSYGVRAVKLMAPPPPPTLSAAPNVIATGQASVNIMIAGTTQPAGEGFFDPGAGFAKRIGAAITGVSVNSVTYTDPVHVTVNVSTAGAVAGSKNVTITNPDGQAVTANALISIAVPPLVTSASATTFTVGAAGAFQVTTSGTPTPAIAVGGVPLPANVTFADNGNGTGTLAGTPVAGAGGTYPISFTAGNGLLPNATQSFTLTVNQAPAITSLPPAGGNVGLPYTHGYIATGFPPSFAYSVRAGALPPGLGISGTSITGTPTTGGTFTGTINAANGVAPDATQNFSITIVSATIPGVPTEVSAVAGNLQAIVGFSPPASDGGASISSYIATCTPTSGIPQSGSGPSSPVTVGTLVNGTTYTCTVHAHNVIGDGPESAASNPVTPSAGAPAILTVSIGGSGTGTVTSVPAGIHCPGTCAFAYPAGTGVELSSDPSGGAVFTGWLGNCTGAGACAPTINGPKSVSATFAPPGTVASLDIDLSSPATRYDALTDGLVVVRSLFGLTGAAMADNAVNPAGLRIDPSAISSYLADIRPTLDVDGNGQADALTDGLLILRYLFGLTGTALTNGAVGLGATRTTSAQIEAYVLSLMP